MKQFLLLLFFSTFLRCTILGQSYRNKSLLPADFHKNIQAIPLSQKNDKSLNSHFTAKFPVKSGSLTSYRISQLVTEAKIGNTIYDFQTDASIYNRLILHADGTLSASWNFIAQDSANSTRGTGYNYFDGTAWGPIPTKRIEPNNRTGFVNIVTTLTGKEISIGHSNTLGGLLLTSRSQKGIGAWTEYPAALGQATNDTWAKAISGGANGETIHVICNGSGTSGTPYLGQIGPLLYSRSLNGGATFTILRSLIPACDSTHNFGYGASSYSIDEKGDTLAIVVGSFTTDLIFLKSTDNGFTWTSRTIQSFPVPFYNDVLDSLPDLNGDGTSDDIETASGDANVILDNNGFAHVFWSNIRVTDTSASAQLGYYPNGNDGLYYWNENFAFGASPDTIAHANDLNGDGLLTIASGSQGGGKMGLYRGGITQMPSSGVDACNNIFVCYQTLCENCDTTMYGSSHKQVYVKSSIDGWNNAINIDQDSNSLNHECVYACMAKRVDSAIHIIYQRDLAPGNSLCTIFGPPNGCIQAGWNSLASDIIYANLGTDTFTNCGLSISNINANDLALNNFPNPIQNECILSFQLTYPSVVEVIIKDVLGKIIYSETKGLLPTGKQLVKLDANKFANGIYFYSVKTAMKEESKKILVLHE